MVCAVLSNVLWLLLAFALRGQMCCVLCIVVTCFFVFDGSDVISLLTIVSVMCIYIYMLYYMLFIVSGKLRKFIQTLPFPR